jgi:hypothetical protein
MWRTVALLLNVPHWLRNSPKLLCEKRSKKILAELCDILAALCVPTLLPGEIIATLFIKMT